MVKLLSEIPGNLEPSGTAPEGGGTGQGDKNYVISPDDANSTQQTGGMSASTTTVVSELPEETKGKAAKIVCSSGAAGDKVTFDVNPIDDGDNSRAGTNEIYIKTLGTYADDDFKVYWEDTTTGEIFGETNIKAGDTYISGTTLPLIATNSIVPTIESNVTDSDGIAVSAVGVLAQTPLVGSLGGWKEYTESEVSITGTNSWLTQRARLVPYKDPISGNWRLRGNINGDTSSATGYTVTVTGITFPAENQAGTLSTNTTATANECYAIASTSNFKIEQGAARSSWWFSFDVEITGKPTWADFDNTVSLGSDLEKSNTSTFVKWTANQTATNATWIFLRPDDVINISGFSYDSGTGIFTALNDFEGRVSFGCEFSQAGFSSVSVRIRNGADSANFSPVNTGQSNLAYDIRLSQGDTFGCQIILSGAADGTILANDAANISIENKSKKSSALTGFPIGPIEFEPTTFYPDKYQEKYLPSDVASSTNDVLNFNNLVIGRRYECKLNGHIQLSSAGSAFVIADINHDSVNLDRIIISDNNNTLAQESSFCSVEFTATTTKVQIDVQVSNGALAGNGSPTQTKFSIKEVNNSIETTDFT